MFSPFRNRREAGRILAAKLTEYSGHDTVVLGLPRGGVPVAYEVAAALDTSLDVFVVRKLGAPDYPELAMGAIASGGAVILNDEVIQAYRIDRKTINRVIEREKAELARCERLYRENRPPLKVEVSTVILVDDGLATGASMRAALTTVRKLNARRIVVAVPVAPPGVCREMGMITDDTVCVESPSYFQAVGQWYIDFTQTSEDEVRRLLESAWNSDTQQLKS